MAAKRYREKFTFWLDLVKDDEFALAEIVAELKKSRTFAKTIRDGIRLMIDLKNGSVKVLRELFPFVFETVAAVLEEERVQLERERIKMEQERLRLEQERARSEQGIQKQLQKLEELLLQQGNIPIQISETSTSLSSGPQQLHVPKFELPKFDEDDELDTIVLQKDTSTDSALNFLNSMMALQ
jgi:hypothetical protein